MNKLFTVLLSFLIVTPLVGQQNFTLYQLRDVPQVMNDNPARYPKSKINIGIPGLSYFYTSFSNSGFIYQDLIHKRKKDDSLTVDMENMLDQLKEQNYFTFHTKNEILYGSFRIKDHYISFNVTEKVDMAFVYPEDFFKLLWEGNGKSFIGERADLNGLGLDLSHYREYSLGYARPFLNHRLRVGGKLKYLYGMENIWTRKNTFGVHTGSENYDLTLDGGMELYTSGLRTPPSFSDYLLERNNHGMGLDVGATYQLFQSVEITASFTDFGFINWSHDVRNFINEEGEFKFEGIHLNNVVKSQDPDVDTKADSVSKEIRDSLVNTLQFDVNGNSYTKFLNPKLQIGGSFDINENHRVGGLLYARFLKGNMRPGFSVSYAIQPVDWFTATANYSAYNRGYSNLGLGFSVNVGPAQFYLTSDNTFAIFVPHKMRNAHLLGGLNITIGEQEEPDEKDAPRL